ncbi:hypothetical protein RJ640_026470 [Escallonia rubra]|uniref:Alpha-carbonic anhydrase domain-containing protein n=1 Tax=Escallonia rubra TaxID=112253 RepID=A0AA88S3Z3_9ASTE|nr:hypothetical protein RJ640_026470 [Escallonia rubra]
MAAPAVFFFLTVALLLVNAYVAASDQPISFSYSGAKGPNKWGSLSPLSKECSVGKLQSPIDIVKDKVVVNKNLKPLIREYHPATATLDDNGFNVAVSYKGSAGVMIADGKNYSLVQMHWHSPSEHRINGVRLAAELHLVHKGDDGSITVLGILYHYGHADPVVHKIQKSLKKLAKEASASLTHAHIALGTFDTKQMRRSTHKYYRYDGSFSTPPCTQNVIWHILAKVRSISRGQVKALKAPLTLGCKNNSRPVQPLNGRVVELYDGEQ